MPCTDLQHVFESAYGVEDRLGFIEQAEGLEMRVRAYFQELYGKDNISKFRKWPSARNPEPSTPINPETLLEASRNSDIPTPSKSEFVAPKLSPLISGPTNLKLKVVQNA